jgi:hypothetical protein
VRGFMLLEFAGTETLNLNSPSEEVQWQSQQIHSNFRRIHAITVKLSTDFEQECSCILLVAMIFGKGNLPLQRQFRKLYFSI